MIGIKHIGTYLPEGRLHALELTEQFGVEQSFIERKTGFVELARKGADETLVDMCCHAFADLQAASPVDPATVDFICVCTQNPDVRLPQASAILQDALGIGQGCASFDISLGCSGYVYSLTVAQAFMESQGFTSGLVFTCDPYSPHLDPDDKNTQLLFGDGATVTHLSADPVFSIHKAAFATIGSMHKALIKEHGGTIHMDGRDIFNFSMRNVPKVLKQCLADNGCAVEDVDLFAVHQASRFVADNLRKNMKIAPEAIPFLAGSYGNTVSSSIPLVLKEYLDGEHATIALCGFGVGLSIAAVVIRRKQ